MTPGASWAPLLERDGARAIEQRLRPFRERGVLDALDIHVVDQLGALLGEADPDVLLALALVVRAPRFGHICVDVASLRVEQLSKERIGESHEASDGLSLPDDPGEWLERIGRSPLVRGVADAAAAQPFVLHQGLLYADRYFSYQARLASHLRARVRQDLGPRDPALLRAGLATLFPPGSEDGKGVDRQKLGAAMALLRGFTVISGGPGTGKTYAVRSVLTLLWSDWTIEHDPSQEALGPRVALAAPTGKAAARMKESILEGIEEFAVRASAALPSGRKPKELERFLAALTPSTIQRLLGYRPSNPTRFRHDATHPVPYDVVVVDEASMVDFALMTKLVDAVAPDARLILLGDQHQLASVEAGTVLADLCGPTSVSRLLVSDAFAHALESVAGISGVAEVAEVRSTSGPYDAIVQLDKGRRFLPESGIGQFARACLADDFDPDRAVAILASADRYPDVALFDHGERGTLRPGVERASVEGYLPYLERLLAGAEPGESLALHHQAVLRLFDRFRVLCAHRRGRLGVLGMNPTITQLLEQELRAKRASRGRVLETHSEFWLGRPLLVTTNDYVVRLFNGDVGLVVEDEAGERKVAFAAPEGVRYVAPSRLPEHETVFSMTIHKSQGSEFDHALVVLPERDSPILTRELVYTGVTRARERMTMVGDGLVLIGALEKTVRRASGLEAELWGEGVG